MSTARQQACASFDLETGGCMREVCRCYPPRCICGRFTRTWEEMHPECLDRMRSEEEADLRRSVEEQGLIV